MTVAADPLFRVRAPGPISSSPLLADADRDGWPEVYVGGPALFGMTWSGETLPRWPKRSRRPFASSPSFGDINGDRRGEIVVGGDDGRIYAFFPDGDPVPGWPVRTGRDVFSTPALVDLDGDGALEVVVGSDDGRLYCLRGTGEAIWIQEMADRAFVSGSPAIADVDGDRRPEIVVGSWDRRMHAFDATGGPVALPLPEAGSVIWSSPIAFVDADGPRIAWASDRVYLAGRDGRSVAGWPRRTESWMASSPVAVELMKGEGPTVVVGAERLYAWDAAGHLRTGFPAQAGDFLWSSPIAFDVDGDGSREILIGSWDGGIHAFRADGSPAEGFPLQTGGPIFATPAAAPLRDGGGILIAASWDGTVRGWRLPSAKFQAGDWLQFRGGPERRGVQAHAFRSPPRDPAPIDAPTADVRVTGVHPERWRWGGGIPRFILDGSGLESARSVLLHYEIVGEGRSHPVPAVHARDGFIALVQPLRAPRLLRCFVTAEDDRGRTSRWPPVGEASFVLAPGGGLFRLPRFFRRADAVRPCATPMTVPPTKPDGG